MDIADHSVRLAVAQAQVAIDIDRDALPRESAVAASLGTVGELLAGFFNEDKSFRNNRMNVFGQYFSHIRGQAIVAGAADPSGRPRIIGAG